MMQLAKIEDAVSYPKNDSTWFNTVNAELCKYTQKYISDQKSSIFIAIIFFLKFRVNLRV